MANASAWHLAHWTLVLFTDKIIYNANKTKNIYVTKFTHAKTVLLTATGKSHKIHRATLSSARNSIPIMTSWPKLAQWTLYPLRMLLLWIFKIFFFKVVKNHQELIPDCKYHKNKVAWRSWISAHFNHPTPYQQKLSPRQLSVKPRWGPTQDWGWSQITLDTKTLRLHFTQRTFIKKIVKLI